MNLEDIIHSLRKARSTPSEEDLRSLPYKKAFITAGSPHRSRYGKAVNPSWISPSRWK